MADARHARGWRLCGRPEAAAPAGRVDVLTAAVHEVLAGSGGRLWAGYRMGG